MQEAQHFGEQEPFSLGLEEELFVVDPDDGRLLNSSPEVLEQLGGLERGEVKSGSCPASSLTAAAACRALRGRPGA